MLRHSNNIFSKRILVFLCSVFMMTTVFAGAPLWTFEPLTPTTMTVPANGGAMVQYRVINQSSKPKDLVMQSIPGITQTAPCQLTPKGQTGSSCTLSLSITGSSLPQNGVHGGPFLCQANLDGSPNPNQCYQPSSTNILNIRS